MLSSSFPFVYFLNRVLSITDTGTWEMYPFSQQVIQTFTVNTIQVLPLWIQSNLLLVAATIKFTIRSAFKHIITDDVPCYGSPAQKELNSFLVPSLEETLNTTLKSNNYGRTERSSNPRSSSAYLNNFSDTLDSNTYRSKLLNQYLLWKHKIINSLSNKKLIS